MSKLSLPGREVQLICLGHTSSDSSILASLCLQMCGGENKMWVGLVVFDGPRDVVSHAHARVTYNPYSVPRYWKACTRSSRAADTPWLCLCL